MGSIKKITTFEKNKPRRINEFINKLNMLYDEYHAELYTNKNICMHVKGILNESVKEK